MGISYGAARADRNSISTMVVVKAGNALKKDFWGYKCAVL